MLNKVWVAIFISICLLVFRSAAGELAVQEQIAQTVKNYLIEHRPEWRHCRLEVQLERPGEVLRKINQKYPQAQFKIDENYAVRRVSARSILPVQIVVNGIEQERVSLSVRARVFQKVAQASQEIPKGSVIQASQIALKETDISQAVSKYFTDPGELAGKIARRSISHGSPVLDWMVKNRPEVGRGSLVKILVQAPGIKLLADGLAMEDGRIGDKIKVKRESVKNYLVATVLSSREVEIAI